MKKGIYQVLVQAPDITKLITKTLMKQDMLTKAANLVILVMRWTLRHVTQCSAYTNCKQTAVIFSISF